MNKLLKILNKLDWVVGAGTVLVGLYLLNGWVVASGVLGLLVAWYKPAERIKKKLEAKFLRKKTVASDVHKVQAEDEFYAQMGVTEPELSQPKAPVTAVSYSNSLSSGPVLISSSRHNQLKVDHLNLAGAEAPSRHWA